MMAAHALVLQIYDWMQMCMEKTGLQLELETQGFFLLVIYYEQVRDQRY
jgi:hypothetical protein